MASIVASTVAAGAVHAQEHSIPNLEQLKTMTARFAPVDLSADVTWQPFDGGHEVPLVVWRHLRKFLFGLARA